MTRPILPHSPMQLGTFSDPDGTIIANAGRYAREAVLTSFEMIGGVDRMAAWADKNPGEFFTKLFPKVITKEVEISAGGGIEELLMRLDRKPEQLGTPSPIVDAEFEIE